MIPAARRLFVVGKQRGDVIQLARRCAWHGDWMSPDDFVRHLFGAPVTNGMCNSCAERFLAEVECDPKGAA